MTQHVIAMTGDSLGAGTAYGVQSWALASNSGNWWELTLRRIAAALGIPTVSLGCRGVWTGVLGADQEWVYTTGGNAWTDCIASDPWDVLPCGKSRYANGINKTATFNRPTINQPPAVGAGIYVVDYANGGRAQYRIDGGTWTQYPFTPDHSNRIVKFYVPGAFTTIEFRGYDGTADCGVMPAAVEPYFLNPNSDGIIWHNHCVGTQTLRSNFASTGGDRLRIIKDVVCIGTDSVSNAPNLACMNININDANLNNDAQWNTDMDSYHTKFVGSAPIHWISPWECGGDSPPNTRQADWRAVTESNAATNGDAFFDLNDKCLDLGWDDGAAISKDPDMLVDGTHLGFYGHKLVARWMYEYVRRQFFSSIQEIPRYAVGAKTPYTDVAKIVRSSSDVVKLGLPLTLVDYV